MSDLTHNSAVQKIEADDYEQDSERTRGDARQGARDSHRRILAVQLGVVEGDIEEELQPTDRRIERDRRDRSGRPREPLKYWRPSLHHFEKGC